MQFQYEPWELSAYALGELPVARNQEFDHAVASDPALAVEVNATREMIASLQMVLASDPESQLDASRRAAVLGSMAVSVKDSVDSNRIFAVDDKFNLSRGFTFRRSLVVLGALAASVLIIGFVAVNIGGNKTATFKQISSANMQRKMSYEEERRKMMQEGYSGGAPADVADAWNEQTGNSAQRNRASGGSIPNAVNSNASGDSIAYGIHAPSSVGGKSYAPNDLAVASQPALSARDSRTSTSEKRDAISRSDVLSSDGELLGGLLGEVRIDLLSDDLDAVIIKGDPKDVARVLKRVEEIQDSSGPTLDVGRVDSRPTHQTELGRVPSEKRLKEVQLAQSDSFSAVDRLETEEKLSKKGTDVALTPRYRLPSMGFGNQPLSELESKVGDGQGVQFSDFDESARKLSVPSAGGRGPEMSGDKYDPITDNPFYAVTNQPLSTFSIDVDTAAYSKVRQYLMELNQLPRPDAVRIEEMINYFQYSYSGPTDDKPFSSSLAVAVCPWQPKHKLVRIALQAKKVDADKRPLSNLVFLLDVSGSMNAPNRLPLVKKSIEMLARQLGENDQVAIVVYAGAAGLVLDTTSGRNQSAILKAIDRLAAGGSTNGGQGIQLAYAKAREQFIPGGVNRVILCTDGDFNVGTTGTDELVRIMEENAKSKIFCTVLGFGMGNTNDAMLQQIADRGNGMHGFIDTELEANRLMVEQISGSLITVAKDVKIQVEFNPAKVSAYRLIGYENRVLAAQDFNNDKKDAGEIGAGHCVTALYEIVPVDVEGPAAARDVDASRYQKQLSLTPAADSGELLTVKLRYKEPEEDKSSLLEFPLVDRNGTIHDADRDFRWSAAMAQFGMLLRQSPYKGESNWDSLLEMAEEAAGRTPDTYREQALQMMRLAKGFSK